MRNIKKVESYHVDNCPICLHKESKEIHSEIGSIKLYDDVLLFRRTFSICDNCESIYMSDMLPKSLISEIYSTGLINSSVTHTENVNVERYEFITENINKKGRLNICDIGCNTGDLLSQFIDLEWNLYGVEISETASKICEERLGIDIDCRDWNKTNYKNKFDIITVVHTLEHSYSPRKFLENCFKSLKEDGVLYLEIPVFNDINHLSINPYNQTHTWCPSTNSTIYILKEFEFYINRIEEEKSKDYESKLKIMATKESPDSFMKGERKNVIKFKRELIKYIKDTLIRWTNENKTIYVYGAGNNAVDLLLGINDEDWDKINIKSFLDKDKKKVGDNIFRIPILQFGEDAEPDCIMILSKLGIEMNMHEHIKKTYPKAIICCPFNYIVRA